MAGQGTAALELIEDGGALDLLLVPVGGGGLIAGCATAADGAAARSARWSASSPRRRRHAALARRRRARPRARRPHDRRRPAARPPGERTFPVDPRARAAVVTVSDAEIVDAMRFAFERLKLVLEPSGASRSRRCCPARASRRAGARGHPVGRQRRRRALSALVA
jgi:threonine dehydratase